ncbi:uncharacterized protein BP5553_01265 [Venustampulla echinocandica]|uniref:Phospholipase/carboxylesterase/thioesterase domain-containing protein n=1 Tax=Venustampulla echinocandica TaxID=2656787 RepID=A0A370U0I9_9HELO|nr:uncharacterized protein BP5553_01265 [Venustampulla echinocandica]RDL41286.1 hypothetical protein BP5553_01265 [Venustampulla echinocandica]
MAVHPPQYVILPTLAHTHTLILLHGRGSSGPEFASDLLESGISQSLPSWKLIFPTALSRHSTVFQENMTEWFDIYSLTDPAAEASLQIDGLREGISYVQALVDAELKDLPAERLAIGGISQGAAVGVHALMGGVRRRLGGFVGLSMWMPFVSEKKFGEEFYRSTLGVEGYGVIRQGRQEMLDTPVLLLHSADDNVVDVALGRETKRVMETLGFRVKWREYSDGGHWIQEPEGVSDLVAFLETVGKK